MAMIGHPKNFGRGRDSNERLRELETVLRGLEAERNHAFSFLRLILGAPYEPLPPGVLDAMRDLVQEAPDV